MSYLVNNIKNLNIYFLPLAAFFLLISSAGTNFFIFLSFATSFYYFIRNKNYTEIFKKNIFKFCFLIYFLFLISCFYSIADNEEIFSLLKKYIKFIYIPFLYYLVKIQKNSDIVIKFFIFGSSLVLILSYLKYYNIFNFNYFYNIVNYVSISNVEDNIINTNTSIFQNYIIHGIILSFYSFLCLYIADRDKSILYYLLSLLAFINVLFLNDSRSGYIIIIILLLLSLVKILTNNKARFFFIALCIGIMSTQFSNNFKSRIGVISDNVNLIKESDYKSSLGYRYMWAKICSHNISNSPILGLGVGSFKISTINYFVKNPSQDSGYYITNNPHNEFISIVSQLGGVGLILFLGFLFFLSKDSNNNILSRGVAVLVIVSSIFNSAFYDNVLGLFIVILICLSTQDNFSKSFGVNKKE